MDAESQRSPTTLLTTTRTVLARRWSTGIGVTLVWVRHGSVDEREGAYFEIPAPPYLALDVYYHPFFYRDFSTVDYEDVQLAS